MRNKKETILLLLMQSLFSNKFIIDAIEALKYPFTANVRFSGFQETVRF